MTIDEHIHKAEEDAKMAEFDTVWGIGNYFIDRSEALEYAKECRQLVEWLKDYKRLKEQEPKTEKVIKMRDATLEEQEYIKSISKPTGIEFDIDIDKKVESYGKLLKHPVIKHVMDMDETPVTLSVSENPNNCDLISREAVEEIITDIRNCISVEGYWAILERLKKLPSVKPQTGHWIDDTDKRAWKCSECGWWYRDWKRHNFCPYCGARMDQEPYDVSDINIGKMSENPTGSKDVIWYNKRNYSEIVVEPQERSDKE